MSAENPVIGEIVSGDRLGYKNNESRIYAECVVCGRPRWVRYCAKSGLPRFQRCRSCQANHRVIQYKRPIDEMLSVPVVGDIILGKDIEKQGAEASRTFVWAVCVDCGQDGRWVRTGYSSSHRRCDTCRGTRLSEAHRGKKLGVRRKLKTWNGYVLVFVYPDHPFFAMAQEKIMKNGRGGYIPEHRLVMAEHLGRCLESWEVVHHLNGNKQDNRLENLELHTASSHQPSIQLQRRVNNLEKRVTLLEAELIVRDEKIEQLMIERNRLERLLGG